MRARRGIWVDQDGGWEDVAAVAILLASRKIKLLGVTITNGIADPSTARTRMHLLPVTIADAIPAGAEILATGPLTRVAELIRQGKAPQAVTWMGGALRVPGNANGEVEWNAAQDAAALAVVLQSTVPLTICPLDLTNRFPTKASVVEGTGELHRKLRAAYGEPDRYFWDELAAASIVAPALFQSEELHLRAGQGGKIDIDPAGKPVRVLKVCNAPGFAALLAASLRARPNKGR